MRHISLISLFMLVLFPDYAPALTGNDIYEQFSYSVVKITTWGTKAGGKSAEPEAGSGFIVYSDKKRTVVVTAAHVIGPEGYWDIKNGKPDRKIKVESLNQNWKLITLAERVTVLHQDDQQDWAILQFNGEGYTSTYFGATLEPLKMAYLLGFPSGKEVVITAQGDAQPIDFASNGVTLRLYMPVTGGQSGGPIFDEHGGVVAIASANDRNRDYDYHVAVPIDLVKTTLMNYVPKDAGFWTGSPRIFRKKSASIQKRNAYGLKLNSVSWQHNYKAAGNFEGLVIYDVTNTSPFTVEELLPDKAGWFGEHIKEAHKFELFGDKKAFHNLDESSFIPVQSIEGFLAGEQTPVTYFIWLPRISPGLNPDERLKYGIRIKTQGTENAAFTRDGSFAGMSTRYPSDSLSGEFNAPDGHTIVIQGYVIRDRSGGLVVDHHEIEAPRLSDRRRVDWRVDNPLPAAIYLVSLRFEPED